MRKYIIFIIIIMVIFIIYTIIPKKIGYLPVFNEKEETYDLYFLDLSKENISTNNNLEEFENMTILEIFPYINPIYKKIINLDNYTFNTILSNKKNISLFMNEYLNKLESNGLKEEIIKYRINGIKINKIKVYASNTTINKIISNSNIKILKR